MTLSYENLLFLLISSSSLSLFFTWATNSEGNTFTNLVTHLQDFPLKYNYTPWDKKRTSSEPNRKRVTRWVPTLLPSSSKCSETRWAALASPESPGVNECGAVDDSRSASVCPSNLGLTLRFLWLRFLFASFRVSLCV